jgi:hypothetical protein
MQSITGSLMRSEDLGQRQSSSSLKDLMIEAYHHMFHAQLGSSISLHTLALSSCLLPQPLR